MSRSLLGYWSRLGYGRNRMGTGIWLAGLIVLFAVSPGELLAQAAKGAPAPGRWTATVDAPAKRIEWPDKLSVSIPQPARQEELLFPTRVSEFCLVGLEAYDSDKAELYNLATGQRVGAISGTPVKSNKRALSPDGKYLALAALDRAKANDIEVWSADSGTKLATFTADDRALPLTMLDFAATGELLTYTFGQLNGKFVYHLRVWDAKSGQPLRQFDLEKNIPGGDKYDISPTGKFLVTLVNPEVLIYDLSNGKVSGSLTPVDKTEDGDFVHLDAMRFSPDGKELALLCEGGKAAVVTVYDMATGAEKFRHELSASMKQSLQHAASYKGPKIEFVEHPAGLLWAGSGLIDRESGLLVWTYRQGILEFSHWTRLLTPSGLIVSTGGNGARKIQSLSFPGEKLEKSLAAYQGDVPAIIKPGEKVKVVIKVGQVRFGKPDEAKSSIQDVLAERLATDGLEVSEDGGTVLSIEYKEGVGKTLQEFKGGNPIRGGGVPTGRTVQSTAAEVQLKWNTKDGKTKIYETTLNLDPSYLSVRKTDTITDQDAREQVFQILKLQLAGLPMPYFVPQDKTLSNLPLMTTSETGPLSKEDALKKKIEAKKKTTLKKTK